MMSALMIVAAFCGMELFTVLFHRYVMHGLGWRLHVTHHRPSGRSLEANDVFVLVFMTLSVGLILAGAPFGPLMNAGLGVALYGLSYFVMHDVVIHRRFLRLPKPKGRYLRAVVQMHMAHHRHVTNDTGEAYGLFFVPPRYWPRS
jgi:beta-carotene 3-hydroxylase